MMSEAFAAIVERDLDLRGPAERVVRMRIGLPEPAPNVREGFRCPFQVTGLSDDAVQYSYGIDTFQALYLAFVAIRTTLKKNASVLSAFHRDFSLTRHEESWETALPVFVQVFSVAQVRRLEQLLESDA